MKILFATDHTYLPDSVSGCERSMHELCVQLKDRKIESGVLCRAFFGKENKNVVVQRRDHGGYPVFRSNSPQKSAAWVVDKFQPDVVVVQVGAIFSLTHAFLQAGIPAIVYFRDVEFQKHDGLFTPHKNICYIANTRFTAERYKALLGIDCKILPPPINREDYKTESKRERILFIGANPIKGIEIAVRIAEECKDLKFLFVESWIMAPAWRNYYISRLQRNNNSLWSKPVQNMREIYSQASLLLAPSVWEESNGRVVTEAQISGIPVLATDRGNLQYTVGPGGRTLPVHSPIETWISTLREMLDDKDEYNRLCKDAKEHAWRAELDPPNIVEKFVSIVDEFLSGLKQ